jgi:hypothetical protein
MELPQQPLSYADTLAIVNSFRHFVTLLPPYSYNEANDTVTFMIDAHQPLHHQLPLVHQIQSYGNNLGMIRYYQNLVRKPARVALSFATYSLSPRTSNDYPPIWFTIMPLDDVLRQCMLTADTVTSVTVLPPAGMDRYNTRIHCLTQRLR